MAEVFGPSYDALTALAPDKPFMIPETSSTEVGGDKSAWIREAFGTDIPTRLPATKAVVWFDMNKEGETDWRRFLAVVARSLLRDRRVPGIPGPLTVSQDA